MRTGPKYRHVFVYNETKETFLAFRVRVADSVIGRLVGLLGHKTLQPDSGVWIVPANSIHTIGMLFTFDLVLIDKNFKVVRSSRAGEAVLDYAPELSRRKCPGAARPHNLQEQDRSRRPTGYRSLRGKIRKSAKRLEGRTTIYAPVLLR